MTSNFIKSLSNTYLTLRARTFPPILYCNLLLGFFIDYASTLDYWNRYRLTTVALHWRHNGHDSISNHQPYDCLLNRLFRRRSKKTSKLRVTGICAGNSPAPGEFPAQMAGNAENVSIWWRHHEGNKPLLDPLSTETCDTVRRCYGVAIPQTLKFDVAMTSYDAIQNDWRGIKKSRSISSENFNVASYHLHPMTPLFRMLKKRNVAFRVWTQFS